MSDGAQPSDAMHVRAGTTDDVTRLRRFCGQPAREARSRWLYEQAPDGPAHVFVAEDGKKNEIACGYAIVPMRFVGPAGRLRVGQAVDGLVHPAYRRQKLFQRVVTYALAQVGGQFDFLVGFPNEKSVGAMLKTGWQKINYLSSWSLPLSGRAIASRLLSEGRGRTLVGTALHPLVAARNRWLSLRAGAKLECVPLTSECSLDFATALDEVQDANGVNLPRTPRFIRWRLLDPPGAPYRVQGLSYDHELSGYFALRLREAKAELVDLLVPPSLASGALTAIALACRNLGYDTLHVQVSPGAYFTSALPRAGFLERPYRAAVIGYPLNMDPKTLRGSDWLLTHADTDWL